MKLVTTEDLLKDLSTQIRVASISAKQCGDHLATHRDRNSAEECYMVAVNLGNLATHVREVVLREL